MPPCVLTSPCSNAGRGKNLRTLPLRPAGRDNNSDDRRSPETARISGLFYGQQPVRSCSPRAFARRSTSVPSANQSCAEVGKETMNTHFVAGLFVGRNATVHRQPVQDGEKACYNLSIRERSVYDDWWRGKWNGLSIKTEFLSFFNRLSDRPIRYRPSCGNGSILRSDTAQIRCSFRTIHTAEVLFRLAPSDSRTVSYIASGVLPGREVPVTPHPPG